MTSQEIRTLVIMCFTDLDMPKEANFHQPLTDFAGWDSLRFARFVISLQIKFSLQLSLSEILSITSLETACTTIAQALQRKNG